LNLRQAGSWIANIIIVGFAIVFGLTAYLAVDQNAKAAWAAAAATSSLFLISRLAEKPQDPQLNFRATQLTQPLQTIFSNLSDQWELGVDEAIDVFVKEIQNKALLKVLQKDSAMLPSLLIEFVKLERELSKKEFEERSKSMFPTHPDVINLVKASVRDKEPQMAELRARIRSEIEQVLAKYSGA
jgi:hypothetical protein